MRFLLYLPKQALLPLQLTKYSFCLSFVKGTCEKKQERFLSICLFPATLAGRNASAAGRGRGITLGANLERKGVFMVDAGHGKPPQALAAAAGTNRVFFTNGQIFKLHPAMAALKIKHGHACLLG